MTLQIEIQFEPICKPQLYCQLIPELLHLISLFISLHLFVVHQWVVSQPLHHTSLIFIWENNTGTFYTFLWWIRLDAEASCYQVTCVLAPSCHRGLCVTFEYPLHSNPPHVCYHPVHSDIPVLILMPVDWYNDKWCRGLV